MEAASEVRTSFELVRSRFVDRRAVGWPSFAADDGAFHALVLGQVIDPARIADMRASLAVDIGGRVVGSTHGDDATDPEAALAGSLRLRVSANTGVARGKIYLAKQKGLPIPEVWAISAAGAPTTDPADAIDGIILPMAQHKGYAIAVIMDMLSGVLTGSGFGTGVRGPYQAEHRSAETAFPAKPIKVIVGFDHVLLPRTLAWQ